MLEKLNKDLEPYGIALQMTQARFTGGAFWQISLEGTTYAVHACDDCFEALLYWLSLPKDNDTRETMADMIADDRGAKALADIKALAERGLEEYAK